MKKIIIASVIALMASAASAVNPEDLRIYINPGHGSWTGNDRPNPIIGHGEYTAKGTDTLNFFESNTNLWKGFGLLEKLIEAGFPFDRTLNQENERHLVGAAKDLSQNLVMSRVKNGPYWDNNIREGDWQQYNRDLYEVAQEVEYNDFDMFISIHSNAHSEGAVTNYPIFMYRGHNGKDKVAVPGSWEMSEAAWPYASGQEQMTWSSTSTYIVGDIDWMSSDKTGSANGMGYVGYLAVLKHGVPGYLVEGYFHTYQPARHRAMNPDADYIEGYQYARGVLDYFGLEKTKTGEIYGIVRDAHEKFSHKYYKGAPRSNDLYLPLNGAKVTLKKDGKLLKEYTTDDYYNGGFVFMGLEPGTYVVEATMDGYKAMEPMEVEVKANLTTYPKIFLENINYTEGVNMDVTYPDPLSGSAYGPQDVYNMTQSYTDLAIPELEGKVVRRIVNRNNRMYILALDAEKMPTVLVYDPVNNQVLANLATDGLEGTELLLSDIQVTADGYLIGCSMELNQNDDSYVQEGTVRGEQWFYKWANDPQTGLPIGSPKKWNSYTSAGLWFRSYVGATFAYAGSTVEGTIVVSCPTITTPGSLRISMIGVNDDKFSSYKDTKIVANKYYADELGDGYRFVTAPWNEGKFLIVSHTAKWPVLEFDLTPEEYGDASDTMPEGIGVANDADINFFRYADKSYMVVTDKDGDNVCGLKLYDVTKGLKSATLVGTTNTALEGEASAKAMVVGGHAAVLDENKNVLSADMALYLMRDGKLTRFTTEGVEQPVNRGNYAYDLGFEEVTDDHIVFAYTLTDAVPEVNLVLTDVDTNEAQVIALGAAEAGKNTYELQRTALDAGKKYTWAIEVKSNGVDKSALLYKAEPNAKASRGGVTWIDDPESDNFGRIVVTQGFAQGIDVYSPTLERQGRYFVGKGNGSPFVEKLNSPFRVGTHNGIAYIVDWTDQGAGYWMFDPSHPETLTDFMGGTNDGTGAHVVDGKVIGGGSTCVTFLGKGEDTKMFSFVEDYPKGNASPWGLQRYDIGTATTLVAAPAKSFADIASNNLMSGTNVEVHAVDNGVFVAQARAVGNVTATSPSFIYINAEGEILFNGAVLDEALESCGSGIAVNAQRNLIAISEKQAGIGIWKLTWNEAGVPAFSKLYMIPNSGGDDEINQLAFDIAGNLYAFHRSDKGFAAYTVRNEAPVATTPAKSALTIFSGMDGIESVAIEAAAAAADEYFDLQGRRVSANALTTGLYLRRQGNRVSKVIVK